MSLNVNNWGLFNKLSVCAGQCDLIIVLLAFFCKKNRVCASLKHAHVPKLEYNAASGVEIKNQTRHKNKHNINLPTLL